MVNALHHFLAALPGKLREEDKHRHMVWSLWLTLALRILWPAPWVLGFVFALGLAKECWDSRFGSGFCWFDMIGNLVGIAAGLFAAEALPRAMYDS